MTDVAPRRRGRPKKEEPVAAEAPPLTIGEPGFLEHMDAMIQSGMLEELTDDATDDLEALLAEQVAEEVAAEPAPKRTKPSLDKFIPTGNGLYLPVRQRVVWMRGEPEPHPDWLIQTELIRFEEGVFSGTKSIYLGGQMVDVADVKGGFAIVQARVLTRTADGGEGPIIGEGTAMERSELFHDFIEKAETAAIGRALAVAGYGTEAALEEGENLADAPIRVPQMPAPPVAPPAEIKIEPSSVPGIQQGGRSVQATQPQLSAIREAAAKLMLSPSAIQTEVRRALPEVEGTVSQPFYVDDVEDNPNGANEVMGFLASLSFEECGKVVQALTALVAEGGS